MSGNIFVENHAALDEIIRSAAESSPSPKLRHRKKQGEEFTDPAVESAVATRKKTLETYTQNARRVELETKRSIEKSIKTRRERESKKFEELCDDIEGAKILLDSIDEEIELGKEATRNKTRRQYEEWNKNVHGKIQEEIAKRMDAKDYKTLNRERNSDYEKFLDITNRKAAIFRDTIIESEYDPLEPNRRSIKAKTGRLKDPTLMILQKHDDESGMLVSKKEKKNYGRDSLNVELWASGQIEATPYGRFNKMMGISDSGSPEVSGAQSSGQISSTMRSTVSFDHFNYPRDKNSLDAERPKGKRIIGPHKDPKERKQNSNGAPDSSWMY